MRSGKNDVNVIQVTNNEQFIAISPLPRLKVLGKNPDSIRISRLSRLKSSQYVKRV